MFKEQYNKLNKQVSPSEKLLQDTIHETTKIENKSYNKVFTFRKPATVFVSICLCLSLAMPVLAATVEPIYELMYMVSPTIAQFFLPVQKSNEDNGVRIEVVSAYIHDNVAEIYITMQDLTENRIDETTDLFDSYSINCPFDSSAHCERVGYDKSTKTATFLVKIEQFENKAIGGSKITFRIKEFLSHKKIYDDIEIPIALSSVEVAKETQIAKNITGSGGDDYKFDEEHSVSLVPSSPISEFPITEIDLTGIGYINGKLHVQTAVENNLEKGNFVNFYLKDNNGNKVESNYSFNFVNDYEEDVDRIDYCNYVFDIPQNEISNYTLHGNFVISGMITQGNWKVTFPLEYQSE